MTKALSDDEASTVYASPQQSLRVSSGVCTFIALLCMHVMACVQLSCITLLRRTAACEFC